MVVPAPFTVLVEGTPVADPLEFEPHSHPLHELVWVRDGTMTVSTQQRVYTVPVGHGLWVPAGTVHSGRTTGGAVLFNALVQPERAPGVPDEVVAVLLTPLLTALLHHLQDADLPGEARSRAEAVLFDVLVPASGRLELLLPEAACLAPVVDALLAEPTDSRSLAEWAQTVGVSERTITRHFVAQTGLSFLQWRQVLRVHHALGLLSQGMAVRTVSERLGYTQPSTFIASFKRVMGTTPGAYASLLTESLYRVSS